MTPAPIDAASGEYDEDGIAFAAPENSTRIRILDIPPEGGELRETTPEEARRHFAEIAAGGASRVFEGGRHAPMRRTEAIDHGIVLERELVLIMDEGETVVRRGDVVIQRGANRGWANRGDAFCRIAFILVDGAFEPGLG